MLRLRGVPVPRLPREDPARSTLRLSTSPPRTSAYPSLSVSVLRLERLSTQQRPLRRLRASSAKDAQEVSVLLALLYRSARATGTDKAHWTSRQRLHADRKAEVRWQA